MGAADGGWLFLRTLSLRAAMLLAVYVATVLGPVELAAFHVAMTLFATVAFALDALAIAAQALIGHRLGQGRSEEHTSELQSRGHLVCRLLLEKKNSTITFQS